jgi:type I restriction enzyme S subunit
MKNWKKYKLGEIASVQTGPFGSQLHQADYVINGIPIITVEHLGENRLMHENLPRVSDNDKERLKKYHLKKGDIVFSRVGSVDRRAFVKQEEEGWLFSGRCLRVRANHKIADGQFLSYFFGLESFKKRIRGIAVGATMPSLNTSIMNGLEITLPTDISEQIQIAQILSSLDDKIELNLQMNQTLEIMAQTLFKEWFVDFNFPKCLNLDSPDLLDEPDLKKGNKNYHNNQDNPKNHCSDILVNRLPKGWRIGSIMEIADLLSGGTPKTEKKEFWNGKIKWISAKDITANNARFILSTEKCITEEGLYNSAAKLLPSFTSVISARGTVGNYCIIPEEMTISQSNYGLKIKKANADFFLFLMVEDMIEMMRAYSYGTVFDTITTKTFHEMEIVIPSDKIINEFERIIKPLFLKIFENQQENQILTQLRDNLLPKLMTGKIEVTN